MVLPNQTSQTICYGPYLSFLSSFLSFLALLCLLLDIIPRPELVLLVVGYDHGLKVHLMQTACTLISYQSSYETQYKSNVVG